MGFLVEGNRKKARDTAGLFISELGFRIADWESVVDRIEALDYQLSTIDYRLTTLSA